MNAMCLNIDVSSLISIMVRSSQERKFQVSNETDSKALDQEMIRCDLDRIEETIEYLYAACT